MLKRSALSFSAGVIVLAALLASARPAGAWEREPLSVYHERRARLVSETGDGVVVLFGYHEADVAASVTTFHQNENFYYLTGWNEPDALLLLVPKGSRAGRPLQLEREVLGGQGHDYRQENFLLELDGLPGALE